MASYLRRLGSRVSSARISSVAGLAAVSIAMLAGCSDPNASARPPVSTLWQTSADLVGSPAVGKRAVVAYTFTASNGLMISAWDLTNGDTLWSAPARLGSQPPGYRIDAAIIAHAERDFTSFLSAEGLRVVDAVTGTDVLEEPLGVTATTRARPCRDDTALCFDLALATGDPLEPRVFVPGTKEVRPDDEDRTPRGARLLGDHVFATDDRGPDGVEKLGLVNESGNVVWTRPYEEVFGDGFTSDNGWWWLELDDVVIGSGNREDEDLRDAHRNGGQATGDQSRSRRVVGLDADTGRTLWEVPGGSACPQDTLAQQSDTTIILCRVDSGGVTVDWRVDPVREDWSTATVSVLGMDVHDGEIRWEYEVSGNVLDHAEQHPVADEDEIVVAINGEPTIVQRTTGATRRADDGVFACRFARPSIDATWEGQDIDLHSGWDSVPCHADATRARVFTEAGAQASGVSLGDDRYLLAIPGGLTVVHAASD